ncbi:Lipocalin-like domain-containing protein [Maribacter sedimenticola]|uniref:Lipocalin-like domain-containing protein n=1 Tax=Maribacter sedimenticola TaxID=228956 RepID=A0ABY1SEC6_9FLAO|nr:MULTISPECIES: lipocalin family protein [Maribacter]TVZ16696.1 lipocalin-like protein [Maribacter sp. MAR_2009_72]SNR28587.1 Lipocalin-like domain-containing protein [Maribacter sedimenticola]
MYRNFLMLLGCALVFMSCSSDKNDKAVEEELSLNTLVGTWNATELRIDNNTASDDAKLAKGILDLLTDKECYVVTLKFNEDLTASARNAASYVELDFTSSSFDVPCPTQYDEESTTYSFENGVVTTTDSNGEVLMIDVSISGDVMTVDATDLDIPNFTDSGELIFVRQ